METVEEIKAQTRDHIKFYRETLPKVFGKIMLGYTLMAVSIILLMLNVLYLCSAQAEYLQETTPVKATVVIVWVALTFFMVWNCLTLKDTIEDQIVLKHGIEVGLKAAETLPLEIETKR